MDKPTRPCRMPGCARYATADGSLCQKHEQERKRIATNTAHRASEHRLYTTRAWRDMRARVLYEHPLCVECEKHGVYSAATDVDHVEPHQGDRGAFFDHDNLQPLCHACHSRKTCLEEGGFGGYGDRR